MASQDGQKTVLALYATRKGNPATTALDNAVERFVNQHLAEQLDYYADYIDLARFPEAGHQDALRELFRLKYADQQFDLIIASSDAVLEFVTRHRDDLFPGVPIVFSSGPGSDVPPNATGIRSKLNLRHTLEIASMIQPDTQRVFVLSGASTWDKYYETLAREQFKEFDGRFAITYLSGLPMDGLLRQVSALPAHSIVYFLTMVEDGAGNRYIGVDPARRMMAVANAPVYSWHSIVMGDGTVGGSMLNSEILGTRLAQLAVRVLRGEKPHAIPVTNVDANVIEFDWRQLRRWGISEGRLPSGSVVRYRQPGAWDQYGPYIIAGATLLGLQTALISGLLLQRARRRRIEDTLRENQQRYALATTAGAVGVWDWNLATNEIYVDPELKQLLGYTDSEIPNRMDDWGAHVHPDDSQSVMARARECIDGRGDSYEVERRMLHRDGTVLWFLSRGTLVRQADGTPDRIVGTDIDITERKRAQRALLENEAALRAYNEEIQDLAGRLIAAQETERTRIARELHDDVSQQLAGLSITLSNLRRRLGARPAVEDVQAELSSLQHRTIELAASVRHVSHHLHPGLLQHSGLVAALTAHCADVERQTGLRVSLHADNDFAEIAPESSLCLYRVTQEALRNTVTHARARRADVRLSRSDEDAEIAIGDDGRGFDVTTAGRASGGLGLLSIHERVRLAGGTVSIVSGPGEGTTVQVRIPIAAHAHRLTE